MRILPLLILLSAGILPGIVYVLFVMFVFTRGGGHLFLTNRRAIYYEKGRSPLRHTEYVGAIDVENIEGIRLYSMDGFRKFLGIFKYGIKKAFYLSIYTSHSDGITIGGTTAMGPGSFEPARDMLKAIQEAGAKLHEIQKQRRMEVGA